MKAAFALAGCVPPSPIVEPERGKDEAALLACPTIAAALYGGERVGGSIATGSAAHPPPDEDDVAEGKPMELDELFLNDVHGHPHPPPTVVQSM